MAIDIIINTINTTTIEIIIPAIVPADSSPDVSVMVLGISVVLVALVLGISVVLLVILFNAKK